MSNQGHTRALIVLAFVWAAVAATAGGCAGVVRNAVPAELAPEASVGDIPHVRAWASEYSPAFQADLVESIRQARAVDPRGLAGADGYINVLTISGGGQDGAFGAGLLCGWTKAGNRPTFKLVTGISTGALIAPFAFVGPEYDHVLKEFYTTISAPDIYTKRPLLSLLSGVDALADTTPLARLIEKVVDERLLADVAKAHNQGRRLYIGTTNLDAGRLTVWNMGLIASSGRPRALDLFRKIMRASASIPVMFPPVLMPVEAGGKHYDEMHVDGGASVQVFFYGFMLDLPAAMREVGVSELPPVRLYIIRNAQIRKDWQEIRPRILPIAGRAVTDLLMNSGVGDLYRIYAIATRDGIDYKLAVIPNSYHRRGSGDFDRGDMGRLFDLGFDLASKGYPWSSLPPGLERTARPATQTARLDE